MMFFYCMFVYNIDVVLMCKKVKCACSIQDENDYDESVVCKYGVRGLQRNLMLVIVFICALYIGSRR